MATASSAASLVLYGKTPVGWRRGSVVYAKNGLPKPGCMRLAGTETPATNTVYQIRQYQSRKAVYVPVGTDYKRAKSLLDLMLKTREHKALQDELGIVIPKTPEQLAAEEAERLAEIERSRKTLQQYADEFLATKTGLSRHSDALYRVVPEFIKFSGRKYLEDVTGQDVTDWYNTLKAADYAPRTCQTRYQTLRGFLMASGVNLSKLIDKASHKRLNKKPDQKTEAYTETQLERLFAACDDYHRVAFSLLLSTGLREREATNLTWAQVLWAQNKILINGEQEIHHAKLKKVFPFKTKNGKTRKVPLFASLKAELMAWREQHPDTIFVLGTSTDQPDGHWLRYLKAAARRAGINCNMCAGCSESGECQEVYLHRFRHTFSHRCLKGGKSIHLLKGWLGHHNISVTSIYLSGAAEDTDVDPFAPKPVTNAKVVAIDYKEAV